MAVSTETMQVFEPATEQVLAELPRAGAEEADEAVARAKAAFPAWRDVAPGDRAKLLRRLARAVEGKVEELAQLEARNVGKPISDARGEVRAGGGGAAGGAGVRVRGGRGAWARGKAGPSGGWRAWSDDHRLS